MNKIQVKRILVVNLSNIGDVILTLPSIDLIKGNFPKARITMLLSPKVKSLFEPDERIDNLIVYDKHNPFKQKINLTFDLRKYKFDMILDFRHTAFPVFLSAKYKSPIFF